MVPFKKVTYFVSHTKNEKITGCFAIASTAKLWISIDIWSPRAAIPPQMTSIQERDCFTFYGFHSPKMFGLWWGQFDKFCAIKFIQRKVDWGTFSNICLYSFCRYRTKQEAYIQAFVLTIIKILCSRILKKYSSLTSNKFNSFIWNIIHFKP